MGILRTITLVLLIGIVPDIARASCSGCCPIIYDAGEIGYAASMTAFDKLAEQIISEKVDQFIGLAGDNTNGEKEIQAAMKTYEGVANSAAATLEQHATAMRLTEQSKYFSPLSHSAFACCGEQVTQLAVGAVDKRLVDDKLYEQSLVYNNQWTNRTAQSQQMRADWTGSNTLDVINAGNIFPLDGTLTMDELEAGSALSNFILHPNPAPTISTGQLATPAGEKYELLRQVKLIRLGPSQKAMGSLISSKAPVYSAQDWAEQLYVATGMTGTPDTVKDGKLSQSSVLDTQIRSRYANPNYLIDMHRKPENGLIRELLAVKAVKLEVLRKRLEVARQTRVVLATQLASIVDMKYDATLQASDEETVKQHVQ